MSNCFFKDDLSMVDLIKYVALLTPLAYNGNSILKPKQHTVHCIISEDIISQ